jgi:hypothetical protein
VTSKLHTLVPRIFGYSVWNLLQVTLLVPKTLRWVIYFWKIHAPLDTRRVSYAWETGTVLLITVRTDRGCSRRNSRWEDIRGLEGGSNRRSVLYCYFTQRSVVNLYRRFETINRSHLQGSDIPRRIPGCWYRRYGTATLCCVGQI